MLLVPIAMVSEVWPLPLIVAKSALFFLITYAIPFVTCTERVTVAVVAVQLAGVVATVSVAEPLVQPAACVPVAV